MNKKMKSILYIWIVLSSVWANERYCIVLLLLNIIFLSYSPLFVLTLNYEVVIYFYCYIYMVDSDNLYLGKIQGKPKSSRAKVREKLSQTIIFSQVYSTSVVNKTILKEVEVFGSDIDSRVMLQRKIINMLSKKYGPTSLKNLHTASWLILFNP